MIAADLLARLEKDNLTLAVAESCTGGAIQSALVAVPGASKSFIGGVTAYADSVKSSLLGVDAKLIAKAGSVSASVSEAMAHAVRDRTGASMAIAATGVAGPSGGTDAKPVGTVWVAILGPGHVINAHRLQLQGDRQAIRDGTVMHAMLLALENIVEWEKEQS